MPTSTSTPPPLPAFFSGGVGGSGDPAEDGSLFGAIDDGMDPNDYKDDDNETIMTPYAESEITMGFSVNEEMAKVSGRRG